MSIRAAIIELVDNGVLFTVEPELGDPIERVMVVTNEMNKLINGPWSNQQMAKRCARLRAHLIDFVRGNFIGICLEPRQHKEAYMGRIGPIQDRVWDIRGRDPSPGLRVFGRFADKDLFISFFCSPRSVDVPWLTRPPLKESDRLWDHAILECDKYWNKLLPEYNPVHGDSINDYVSENVFQV